MPVGSTDVDTTTILLGGVSTERTLTGTITTGVVPISVSGYLFDGLFGLDLGTGDRADLVLEWGAGAEMNLNLLSQGDNFSFTHWLNDGVTGSTVEITVWNGATSFTAPTTTLTHGSFGGPATTYDYLVPFSSFSGADFTDIDRVSLTLHGNTSADVALSNFSVVPEPSAALLIGFSGSLALFRRRRRC